MGEGHNSAKRRGQPEAGKKECATFTLLTASVQWPPETFIWRLVKECSALGHRVQVVVSVRPGQKIPDVKGVDVIRSPSWNVPWVDRLVCLLRLLAVKGLRHPKALYRLVRLLTPGAVGQVGWREVLVALYNFLPFVGLEPDVLHFQWNATAIECLPLFDYFKCPVVVSCRGSQVNVAPHNPRRVEIREGLRKTFQRAAAVHCVARSVEGQAARYGLDRSKSRVIRPAVDPDFYEPKKRTGASGRNPLRIVSTGSLLWVKGHEYSLLAVRRLLDCGVPAEFEIIGGGPEHQRVMYTVNDLNLQKHVRLCGQLSPEGVRERLMLADIFLLSSLSEGISNAALEAMACGLPVVTTDCGGMREAVTHGVDGFVVPVRDVDGMAEALRRLAEDSELRHCLGQAARQRVVKDFSLKQQAAQFIELYAGLIESTGLHGRRANN